jgi:ERCC4-type nuclease
MPEMKRIEDLWKKKEQIVKSLMATMQKEFRQFYSKFMGISFTFQATANVLSSIAQPIKAFPNQICFSF